MESAAPLAAPDPAPAAGRHRGGSATFWVLALFFLSGATSLTYEVIWFKRFTHVWGGSSLALASVVGSFLLGLGLGAFLLGRLADRLRVPLRAYGLAEIAIGLLALAVPFEIDWLLEHSGFVYGGFEDPPFLRYVRRLAFTFAVLGPPTMLMGGTLPLLVRQLDKLRMELRLATGWLYGINTLGAATGCFLAGFYLVPALGMPAANLLTVALNVLIGLASFAVAGRLERAAATLPASSQGPEVQSERVTERGFAGRLYVAVALAACSALVLQVVWARKLSLILGGSTYAFTAMLFVILIGIGLGSLVFRAWSARRHTGEMAPAVVFTLMAGTAAAGLALIPTATELIGLVRTMRASPTFNAVACVGVSVWIELLPALGMGFVFPMFVDLARRRGEAGAIVGRVYLWNTLGTILGATVTASVFLPRFGTNGALGVGLLMACLATLLLFPRRAGPGRQAGFIGLVGLQALFAMLVFYKPPNPQVTDVGMYLYGPPQIAFEPQFYEEGSSCNVYVSGLAHYRDLRVNGKIDATNLKDMKTQLGIAYLPLFMRPDAEELLIIGYGSGSTVGAALQFPDTRVVCCEIEPAIFAASRFFEPQNHSPQVSERFRMILDDGRLVAQVIDKRYDLIISQPSNPWLVGVSNLFTREFYEVVRERLTADGVLAQWIQAYEFSEEEYALVVRTLKAVFPYVGFLHITAGDTMLLASMEPLEVSPEALDRAQDIVRASPAITADLERYFSSTSVRSLLLRHFLLGNEQLEAFLEEVPGTEVNTDYNMRLEYEAAGRVFQDVQTLSLFAYLHGAIALDWFTERFRRWNSSESDLAALLDTADFLLGNRQSGAALRVLLAGLELAPEDPRFLARWLVLSPRPGIEEWDVRAARLAEQHPAQAAWAGSKLLENREPAAAAALLERVTAQHPDSASAWRDLGRARRAMDDPEGAAGALRRALELDPSQVRARAELNELSR